MKKRQRVPLADRFWKHVQKSADDQSCWVWTGAASNSGYGHLFGDEGDGRIVSAHRVSWEIHYGPIPEGLYVCHHCDNRKCVRPTHLFLGTPLDNVADMVSKGRQVRHFTLGNNCTPPQKGEANTNARLTVADVVGIRGLWATGNYTKAELGRRFGVTPVQIQRIVTYQRWAHIP